MIKANELRIGNYVNYKGDAIAIASIEPHYKSDPTKGELIGMVQTKMEFEFIGRWLDHLEPIPLTPEWLERCGFKDGEIKWSYKLHMHVRPYQTTTQGVFPGEWRVTLIETVPYSVGQSIKYVHQLQNLYFALTGEELNVKL